MVPMASVENGPELPSVPSSEQPVGDPAIGSAPTVRPPLKMKRTGKTGLLLPGLAASPMDYLRAPSSSTSPVVPIPPVAPTASPQSLVHSQSHPVPYKAGEIASHTTPSAPAGLASGSMETDTPTSNAASPPKSQPPSAETPGHATNKSTNSKPAPPKGASIERD